MPRECANKCYHNFGREKKAFVWGHNEKPLYAKGFCKQCYLCKYKQKTIVKSELTPFEEDTMRKAHTLSEGSNGNYFESMNIQHERKY